MTKHTLFERLWNQYIELAPKANHLLRQIEDREQSPVINDHIAIRTIRWPGLGLNEMARPFEALGYQEKRDYHFKEKKLYAKHYEISGESDAPKIFISELLIDQLSPRTQDILKRYLGNLKLTNSESHPLIFSGRPWVPSYEDYKLILNESEYAAWMLAFGFCTNHFTVSVNHLKTFQSLPELNSYIKACGYPLNTAGGEIKGSPSEYLEQSSTLAEKVEVHFLEGKWSVPSCYYEFAFRYPMADGQIYQGFVPTSADKIFESTDTKQQRG